MATLEALQVELKGAKEKWSELKLGKAKKEAETFPYPVWCMLAVQQPPSAAAFDVFEIPVKLIIEGLEPGQIKVEVPSTELPAQLQEKCVEEIAKIWKKNQGKKAPWGIAPTFDWVETNFSKLLLLDPACVGSYEGCDDNGASMRRYAIGPPAKPAEPVEEEEESSDEEEDEAYAQQVLAARIAELMAEAENDGSNGKKKLSPEEIQRRRDEAGEMGEKAATLSKKERDELNKSRKEKSGSRQAKTGQANRKFEGDGATTKEEKKKKNDANVKKRFGLA